MVAVGALKELIDSREGKPTRDLTTGGPQELAEVAVIRKSLGHDWRVTVKDAGRGPCIDVREYITEDAYPSFDTRPVDVARKGARRRTKADGYIGPTKAGLWMSIPQAVALMDAIASALDIAETLATDDDTRRDLA